MVSILVAFSKFTPRVAPLNQNGVTERKMPNSPEDVMVVGRVKTRVDYVGKCLASIKSISHVQLQSQTKGQKFSDSVSVFWGLVGET